MSMHQVTLHELLAVSKFRGTMPERVVLLGIQPSELDWGMELSTPVRERLGGLVKAALAQVREWEGQ
jgi:hydrogenase maturation protease